MAIRYYTDQSTFRLPRRRDTRRWLDDVARAEGYAIRSLNIVFCSSERLTELNRRFLGHDYPTDVVTFDDSDRAAGLLAGEIYIDVETVRANARRFGATFLQEMRRVVVHGVLHLSGHGDKSPDAERAIHAMEDRYLAFWANAPQP